MKNGVMECWNNGVMVLNAALQYSNTLELHSHEDSRSTTNQSWNTNRYWRFFPCFTIATVCLL
jgi:hypothetical protein